MEEEKGDGDSVLAFWAGEKIVLCACDCVIGRLESYALLLHGEGRMKGVGMREWLCHGLFGGGGLLCMHQSHRRVCIVCARARKSQLLCVRARDGMEVYLG